MSDKNIYYVTNKLGVIKYINGEHTRTDVKDNAEYVDIHTALINFHSNVGYLDGDVLYCIEKKGMSPYIVEHSDIPRHSIQYIDVSNNNSVTSYVSAYTEKEAMEGVLSDLKKNNDWAVFGEMALKIGRVDYKGVIDKESLVKHMGSYS